MNFDQIKDQFLCQFPDNATSWSQATDEIRTFAVNTRVAYNDHVADALAGEPGYIEGLDFRSFKTPAAWNAGAKAQINPLWSELNDWAKANVLFYSGLISEEEYYKHA